MRTFAQLDGSVYTGKIIILDVDGTLTHDTGSVLEENVASALRSLSDVAHVHLVSNGPRERTQQMAALYNVSHIDSEHNKPSRRVMEKFAGPKHGDITVIGDKAITDGLFAANIGADFVHVSHVRHADDPWFVRATYVLDRIAGIFIRVLFPALPLFILLRPQQWVKNVLVFAPIFFAGTFFDGVTFFHTTLAFAAFCAAASAMYVFNDIGDAENDRAHPAKRWRPVANGAVSVRAAYGLFLGLCVVVAGVLFALPSIVLVITAYIVGNLVYTLSLKHTAIIDVVCVALFYVARIAAGGVATGTSISPWIILCVFAGALVLAIGKRRAEFAHASRRAVLAQYSQASLDMILAVSATLAIASYALYSVLGTSTAYMEYSTVFVVAALLRLLNRLYVGDNGAEYPETLVFKDRWILGLSVLWAVYMCILFYI